MADYLLYQFALFGFVVLAVLGYWLWRKQIHWRWVDWRFRRQARKRAECDFKAGLITTASFDELVRSETIEPLIMGYRE